MNIRRTSGGHVKAAKEAKKKKQKKSRIFISNNKGNFIRSVGRILAIFLILFSGTGFAAGWIRASHYGHGFGGGQFLFGFVFLCGLALFLRIRETEKRMNRFRYYRSFLEGKEYMLLSEMEQITGRKVTFLQKDLSKMIRQKWFLQADMNREATCLFLTKDAFFGYKKGQIILTAREEADSGRNEDDRKDTDNRRNAENGRNTDNKRNTGNERNTENGRQEKRRRNTDNLRNKKEQVKADFQMLFRKKEELREEVPEADTDTKPTWEAQLESINYCIARIQNPDIIKSASDLCIRGQQIIYFKDTTMFKEVERFLDYYLPAVNRVLETYVEMQREEVEQQAEDLKVILNTIQHSFNTFVEKLIEGKRVDVEEDIASAEIMLSKYL